MDRFELLVRLGGHLSCGEHCRALGRHGGGRDECKIASRIAELDDGRDGSITGLADAMYEVVLEVWNVGREVSSHFRDYLRVVYQRIGIWSWVSHAEEGRDNDEGRDGP